MVVGGHARIPFLKHGMEGSIERSGAGLQQMMGALLRPLHLLAFDDALADQDVDRRLDEGGGNPLALPPAFSIVRARALVIGDVGMKLTGLSNEALHV